MSFAAHHDNVFGWYVYDDSSRTCLNEMGERQAQVHWFDTRRSAMNAIDRHYTKASASALAAKDAEIARLTQQLAETQASAEALRDVMAYFGSYAKVLCIDNHVTREYLEEYRERFAKFEQVYCSTSPGQPLLDERDNLRKALAPVIAAARDKTDIDADDWNPDAHIELTLTVSELKAAIAAMEYGNG